MVDRYRSVLAVPGCARVFGTALIGRLPQGMTSLAILLLVREHTHSYAAAGVAVGAYDFATAGGAPVLGRLVDRFGRRRVLPPVAIVQCMALCALVFAAHRGAGAASLIALSALAGSLMPPIAPAVRALLRDLLPDPDVRETAYAMESVIQEVIWIAGPLVVGAVIAVASPTVAILISTSVCVAGTTLFVTSPGARDRGRRALHGRRPQVLAIVELRAMLGPIFLTGLAIGAISVGLPALALHAGSRPASGVLLAVWSLGSVTGGLWSGARTWRTPLSRRYPMLLLGGVLCTAPLILARTIPEGVVGAMIAGLTLAPVFSCQYALVGRAVPAGVETEAFTWVSSALIGGLAAGAALGGAAVASAGFSAAFALGCASMALAGLSAARPSSARSPDRRSSTARSPARAPSSRARDT